MQQDELVLRIKAQGTEFSKQLDDYNIKVKAIKNELKEIEKTKGIDSEEYKKAKQELKDTEAAAKALAKELRSMDVSKMSMRELQLEAKNLAKEMNNADRSTKQYADAAKRLGEVEHELAKAKQQASQLKQEGANLSMTFKDKVIKSFQDFGVIGVASLAAVGAAVKSAFSYIIDSFSEFEQSAADTKGELGLTKEQITELRNEAQKVGPQFGKTAKEMMEAYNAVGSGKSELVSTKNGLQDVTNAAIKLSTVAQMDMNDAAKVMVESLNQYGAESKDAAKYVDILATGTKVGAAKINEISESLKYVGPVAKSAGVSFGQTNAALQVLSQNGIKGEMAGTSLRGTLLELATSTDKTINPTIVGLEKAMENLAKKNLTAAQMSELVGKTNVSAAIALRDNVGKLKDWTEQIEKGGGAASMYADKTDTLKFQIKQASAVILNYAVSIGEKLAPAISGTITLVLALIEGIASIPKFLYDNRIAIGGLAIALLAFNGHLIAANAQLLYNATLTKGKMVWDNAAAAATRVFTVAQNGLNLAMRANPVGLVISALVALGTIIYSVYEKSQTFRAGIAGIWALMKEGVSIISRIWNALKNLDFITVAKEMALATTNMAKAFVGGYIQKVRDENTKTKESIKKDNKEIIESDTNKTQKLVKNIGDVSDKQNKALEEQKKAYQEALDKIAEMQDEAYIEHIRKTQGEVAAEKVKLQQKAEAELLAVQKSLANQQQKAVLTRLINEKLLQDIENLEDKFQKENEKKAEESVKKEADLAKKRLDAEKFILTQETEAHKAYFDLLELRAKGNSNNLLKVQKDRLDEDLKLIRRKLALEQSAEEQDAKEKIKDKEQLEKTLLQIQGKYQRLDIIEFEKTEKAKNELAKKAKEEREKIWKNASDAFQALLKGDLNTFATFLGSMVKSEKEAWQQRLDENMSKFAAVADAAKAAVAFLNDLAQQRAEKEIAEIQRAYEVQKATLEKQLSENKASIEKAEEDRKNLKEQYSEKIKSIKEQEQTKIKSLEDFYRSLSSADAKADFNEQVQLARDEAQAKIEAARRAADESKAAARETRDERIIAAEAARDAEIAAINRRTDIDRAAKDMLIAAAKSKAEQEISLAKEEYDLKVKLSLEEKDAKIKDAQAEADKKIELMKELMTADKEKAKELIEQAKKEAEEKIEAAEKEKLEKLKLLEQEKAARVQEKKDLEAKMLAEEKKAKQDEYNVKLQAWKAQQRADVTTAIIQGSLAALKALASGGFPLGLVFAAVMAGLTAIQINKIMKQAPPAPPTFRHGGIIHGPKHGPIYGTGGLAIVRRDNGREEGEMEGNEYIVPADQTALNLPLLQELSRRSRAGIKKPIELSMPPAFKFGGVVNDIPWGKPIFQYGGIFKKKMYQEGGMVETTEGSANVEGSEQAQMSHQEAIKLTQEQLEVIKEIRDGTIANKELLMRIADSSAENVNATREVSGAVRDSNTNAKFDTLINQISNFGSKAA